MKDLYTKNHVFMELEEDYVILPTNDHMITEFEEDYIILGTKN